MNVFRHHYVVSKNIKNVFVVSLLTGFLMGCGISTSGEPFTEVEFNKEKESIVYFYRPKQFYGWAATHTIRLATHTITDNLKAGGYTYAVVPPGEMNFVIRNQDGKMERGTLTIAAGQTVYVSVLPSQNYGVIVEEVEAGEGAEEIANMKLVDGKRLTK